MHAIFYDLTKASDCILHNLLVEKLSNYNFNIMRMELNKSYLSDRRKFVSYSNCFSDHLNIKCGEPQGSALCSTLFLVYIKEHSFQQMRSVCKPSS